MVKENIVKKESAKLFHLIHLLDSFFISFHMINSSSKHNFKNLQDMVIWFLKSRSNCTMAESPDKAT